MTLSLNLRSSELQSDSDLDSIGNSCDVFLDRTIWIVASTYHLLCAWQGLVWRVMGWACGGLTPTLAGMRCLSTHRNILLCFSCNDAEKLFDISGFVFALDITQFLNNLAIRDWSYWILVLLWFIWMKYDLYCLFAHHAPQRVSF